MWRHPRGGQCYTPFMHSLDQTQEMRRLLPLHLVSKDFLTLSLEQMIQIGLKQNIHLCDALPGPSFEAIPHTRWPDPVGILQATQ